MIDFECRDQTAITREKKHDSKIMWNPFGDIHKDWIHTKSRWGSAKVIMFYVYLWVAIGLNGYRIYEPLSFGWNCLTNDNQSKATQEWITLLIRQYSVFVCAWGLVLVQSKSKLQSLQMLFITGVASLAILWVNMESAPNSTCFSRINATWPLTVGWPFITLLCGYVEDRITESKRNNENNNDSDGIEYNTGARIGNQKKRIVKPKRYGGGVVPASGSDSSQADDSV